MVEKQYLFPFEKLEVWKAAKALSIKIYRLTELFPDHEKYGITSQVRRAAVSIPSNIAEGTARFSRKEQAHFTQISYSSLMELLCQLIIAEELSYITRIQLHELKDDVGNIARMLNALRKSQLSSIKHSSSIQSHKK